MRLATGQIPKPDYAISASSCEQIILRTEGNAYYLVWMVKKRHQPGMSVQDGEAGEPTLKRIFNACSLESQQRSQIKTSVLIQQCCGRNLAGSGYIGLFFRLTPGRFRLISQPTKKAQEDNYEHVNGQSETYAPFSAPRISVFLNDRS